MRRIRSESTLAQRRAIAPAARKERAETCCGIKPRVGPRTSAAIRRSAVRSEGVNRRHEVEGGCQWDARGIVAGAA
eukprot:scaffold18152_cov113-Cylindrotheca_fusiformis.AAC.1